MRRLRYVRDQQYENQEPTTTRPFGLPRASEQQRRTSQAQARKRRPLRPERTGSKGLLMARALLHYLAAQCRTSTIMSEGGEWSPAGYLFLSINTSNVRKGPKRS